MIRTVFYSWMSDLPNNTNRGFIEKALRSAVKELSNDGEIHVEARVDADTSGVPGSPDIANTLFKKIRKSDVFVADVSIVPSESQQARPTPNPNVLIELGYALSAIGEEHVIMVFNQASGDPKKDLPFDLGLKRAVLYNAPTEDTEGRARERAALAGRLKTAVRAVMDAEEVGAASSWISDVAGTLIDLRIALDDFDRRHDGWWHEGTFTEASTALARLAGSPGARFKEDIANLAELCDDIAVEARRRTYSNIKELLSNADELARRLEHELLADVPLAEESVSSISRAFREAGNEAAELRSRAEKMMETGRYQDVREQAATVGRTIRAHTLYELPLDQDERIALRGLVQDLSIVDDGDIVMDGGKSAEELLALLKKSAEELPRIADRLSDK